MPGATNARLFVSEFLAVLMLMLVMFSTANVENHRELNLKRVPRRSSPRRPLCLPVNIKNGSAKYLSKRPMTIQYGCREGFDLKGAENVTCVDGKWVPPLPYCVAIASAANEENRKLSSTTVPNQNAAYKQLDYDRTYPRRSSCLPVNIKNSNAKYLSNRAMTIQYRCREGFELQGADTVECVDGKWVPPLPICVAIASAANEENRKLSSTTVPNQSYTRRPSCLPVKIKNGSAKYLSRRPMTIQYRCREGYELRGAKNVTCVDGKWEPPLPNCVIAKGCPRPNTDPLVIVKEKKKGAVLEFSCPPGYRRDGPAKANCNGVKWNRPAPNCTRLTSPMRQKSTHRRTSVGLHTTTVASFPARASPMLRVLLATDENSLLDAREALIYPAGERRHHLP